MKREEIHHVKRRVQTIPSSSTGQGLRSIGGKFHPEMPVSMTTHDLSDGEMTDATDITLDSMVRANIQQPLSPLDTLTRISTREIDTSSTTSENSQKEYIVSEGVTRRPKTVSIVQSTPHAQLSGSCLGENSGRNVFTQSKTVFQDFSPPGDSMQIGQLQLFDDKNMEIISGTTSVTEEHHSSQSKSVTTTTSDGQSETMEQEQSSQSQYRRETKKEKREDKERRLSLKERVQLFEDQASPFLKGPRVNEEH